MAALAVVVGRLAPAGDVVRGGRRRDVGVEGAVTDGAGGVGQRQMAAGAVIVGRLTKGRVVEGRRVVVGREVGVTDGAGVVDERQMAILAVVVGRLTPAGNVVGGGRRGGVGGQRLVAGNAGRLGQRQVARLAVVVAWVAPAGGVRGRLDVAVAAGAEVGLEMTALATLAVELGLDSVGLHLEQPGMGLRLLVAVAGLAVVGNLMAVDASGGGQLAAFGVAQRPGLAVVDQRRALRPRLDVFAQAGMALGAGELDPHVGVAVLAGRHADRHAWRLAARLVAGGAVEAGGEVWVVRELPLVAVGGHEGLRHGDFTLAVAVETNRRDRRQRARRAIRQMAVGAGGAVLGVQRVRKRGGGCRLGRFVRASALGEARGQQEGRNGEPGKACEAQPSRSHLSDPMPKIARSRPTRSSSS